MRRSGHLSGFAVVVAAAVFLAVALPRPAARAEPVGAGYSFDGGTARERSTVRAALAASAFEWRLLPGHVTIHIARQVGCHASEGHIWLDSRMLARGVSAWGVVQHEYAHQVDYFLLDDAARARLGGLLGTKTWWPGRRYLRHDRYGSERFASTLAYAYWPSPRNSLIRYARTEVVSIPPAQFRRVLSEVLGVGSLG